MSSEAAKEATSDGTLTLFPRADSQQPLLDLPKPDASAEEWLKAFPMSKLPALWTRDSEYCSQPLTGVGVVLFFSTIFFAAVIANVMQQDMEESVTRIRTLSAISSCVATAVICLLYLLLGEAGMIRRSAETCYPIPKEVMDRLQESGAEGLHLMTNIKGSEGKSYCVRCCVWRPPESHHCSICQRCVIGFDHHCGVFGRCIVQGNMICFWLLILMLPAGFIIVVFSCNEQATAW